MTQTASTIKTGLQRRFPHVDFVVRPAASDEGVSVSWRGAPETGPVVTHLRATGWLAIADAALPGYVRVKPPRNQPSGRIGEATRTMHSAPPSVSLGTQGLWSLSDLEVIRTTADRWVRSLANPSTVAYYTGGLTLLLMASGYLAWVLDIRPSLIFGQHLAAQLASEWLNLRLLTTVIFLLSITPNLLEFFATGLATHGNVIVDLSIKAALLFDAATDAPMAYSIAKAFIGFFITEPGFWSELGAILLAIPILLLATIVVEILFLSFLTAWVLLLRRAWEVR